jgi:hypothetical protein
MGKAYSAPLAATGGTTPLSWSLSAGTLPPGLTLDSATGLITGTPTGKADHTSLTLDVHDSGTPVQSASVSLTLTVSPADISVSISPRRAGVVVTQKLVLKAATTDLAGVTWSVNPTGGSFETPTSNDGDSVTFTAPTTAGVYSIKATSVTDATRSTTLTVGVTDLAGVSTYHNNLSRDGVNDREFTLTTANVHTSTFGKLFSCNVDGAIYAQPLWVPNLTVKDTVRNVVYVATQHNSLYAFDADTSPCAQLWKVSLIDSSHGGTGGERAVPAGMTDFLVGQGEGDLMPEVGISGTPAIDLARGILFVVSKSTNAAGSSFFQRLHAIDLATGKEEPGSPVNIAATYPGTGDGGTTVAFNPRSENQRTGLALVNGTIYIAWGSHEDAPTYYGWVIGYTYNGASFKRTAAINVAPNETKGGIWMSGAAPAADSNGNLYVSTSNGVYNADGDLEPNNDYGDSLLQLSGGLKVLQHFTPTNQHSLDIANNDFGAGGTAVLGNLPAGSAITHVVIAGGKDGWLYVLDRDALGGLGDSNARQKIRLDPNSSSTRAGAIFCTGALWNGFLYIAGSGTPMTAYKLNTSNVSFSVSSASTTPTGGFGFPGTTPSVSSMGTKNGIVWALDTSRSCTHASPKCGPTTVHAYDATDMSKQLWNSSLVSDDVAGFAVRFAVPTIVNGKVYVGTRGNNKGDANSSTSIPGELDVYGLKPD